MEQLTRAIALTDAVFKISVKNGAMAVLRKSTILREDIQTEQKFRYKMMGGMTVAYVIILIVFKILLIFQILLALECVIIILGLFVQMELQMAQIYVLVLEVV